MVKLNKAEYDMILAHARACLPEEACGLIAGRREGENAVVEKVYLLENADRSREHFTMTPQAQLDAVRDMRLKGLTPLGNWHSHPESPSRPSEEDKRLAYDGGAHYLILSLMTDPPTLNSFRIRGGESEKEELIIE